jgi:hypothetical protein
MSRAAARPAIKGRDWRTEIGDRLPVSESPVSPLSTRFQQIENALVATIANNVGKMKL